jgi:hypothetical protein
MHFDDIKSTVEQYFSANIPKNVKFSIFGISIRFNPSVDYNGKQIVKMTFTTYVPPISGEPGIESKCTFVEQNKSESVQIIESANDINNILSVVFPQTPLSQSSHANIWRAIDKLASAVELLHR